MSLEQFRIEVHNPHWQKSQYINIRSDQPKQMWKWQQDAFQQCRNERFTAIQASCGSGKSHLQTCLGTDQIVKSKHKQKQLIVVPQEHIAHGFAASEEYNYIWFILDGEEYEWNIQPNHHFCEGISRTRRLKKWLLASPKELAKFCNGSTISGLNAVCSSAALVQVWEKLTKKERKKARQHLTLRLDEAHHIKHAVSDEDELAPEIREAMEYDATGLGRICTSFLNGSRTCGICTTTATMYRGDRKSILSPASRKKFKEYNLDWIDHFNSVGIESFYFSYEEYDKDPTPLIIENVKEERDEYHLIVIPSSTHKWRQFGDIELNKLLAVLWEIYPKDRILDLVTKRYQKRNKQRLLAEPKTSQDGKPRFNVIVMCMLGREGTDWCPCSRLHNASCESSITLAVQTVGRVFRKFDGKRTVKIKHYVRHFEMPNKKMSKIDLLTDRTNALLVCMQLDDMTNPILVPIVPNQKGEEKIAKTKIALYEVFGDQWENVQRDLYDSYEILTDRSKVNIHKIIDKILDEYQVVENRKNIRDGLLVKLLRAGFPDLRIKGINISFLRKKGYGILERDDSLYFRDVKKSDWHVIRKLMREYRRDWMPFKQAQEFARNLELKGVKEWLEYCKYSDNVQAKENELISKHAKLPLRPVDIPVSPDDIYENKGWSGWRDFLGNDWRPFKQARQFVRSLGLGSINEWLQYAKSDKKPNDMPVWPCEAYRNKGWTNWADFLGTQNYRGPWRKFKQARKYARSLGLKSGKKWYQYARSNKNPNDIPNCPEKIYKNEGWKGWGDWLGTQNIHKGNWRSFDQARKFAKSLGLETIKEWYKYARSGEKPSDIPINPQNVYKSKGWMNWADFLGTRRHKGGWKLFKQARDFVKSLGLKSYSEWCKYAKTDKRPNDIPVDVQRIYKSKGWTSWPDFLGTQNQWKSFEEAKKFARNLELKSYREWHKYAAANKCPKDIPRCPDLLYKNKGWTNWADFLGTQNYKTGWRPFEEAKKFARNLGLKSYREWHKYVKSDKKPSDVPAGPQAVYKNQGWDHWGDWLGTNTPKRKTGNWKSFEQAREFVRSLGLKNGKEWYQYAKTGKKPSDIPIYPRSAYKNEGWKGTGDWLGTGFVANQNRKHRPFKQARDFARSLGLKNGKEWFKYARTDKRLNDIPISLYHVYKDKGWRGMKDWLGTN